MEIQQKIRQDIDWLNQIESKFFRDLYWLLYCDNIEHPSIRENISFKIPPIELSKELEVWLNSKSNPVLSHQLPLGKYAEQLLLFYFKKNKNYQVYLNNFQLKDDLITVGEIDFLIYDTKLQQKIHLEFAIKYYLKFRNEFIGPNAKDKMQNKMQRLLKHQSTILDDHTHLLPEEFRKVNFNPKVLLKGCLFYPFEEWVKQNHNPLNTGWWLYMHDLTQIKKGANFFYLIINKLNWIYPFYKQELFNFETIKVKIESLLNSSNAFMIVRLNKRKEVVDRGFIVSNHWPNQSK